MNPVRFGSTNDVVARMPSPKIWADCPVLQFQADPAKGFYAFDDFKNSVVDRVFTSQLGIIAGDINWYAYEDGDITDVIIIADDNGILKLDSDGTDDDVTMITTGANLAGIIRSPLKGERKKFWFEARVAVSTITNTDMGIFVGLAEPGQAKNGYILGAASALADVDYFGFYIDEADGDDLNVVYNEATLGTAQATHDFKTMTVLGYVRLGMRLDVDTDIIKCYLDGVYMGTTYDIDISTANFPSNTNMDILIGQTSGAGGGDGDYLAIDWVRVAQEY